MQQKITTYFASSQLVHRINGKYRAELDFRELRSRCREIIAHVEKDYVAVIRFAEEGTRAPIKCSTIVKSTLLGSLKPRLYRNFLIGIVPR